MTHGDQLGREGRRVDKARDEQLRRYRALGEALSTRNDDAGLVASSATRDATEAAVAHMHAQFKGLEEYGQALLAAAVASAATVQLDKAKAPKIARVAAFHAASTARQKADNLVTAIELPGGCSVSTVLDAYGALMAALGEPGE